MSTQSVRRTLRSAALLIVLLLSLSSAQAQYRAQFPLPAPNVPGSIGVNIHFTDPKPGEMELIARAGFRWVRMDFAWAGIESQPGHYDFAPYDRLMIACKAHAIRPIFILDYGNNLYQQGPPRSPAARAAFCRFVQASLVHFRHQGVLWEMWNEPNGGFWGAHADVDEYIVLAKAVGRTLRAAAPDEWYIGPALAGMDWPFLTRCLQSGLLDNWDAISVHPYRQIAPESAATDFERIRELIDRYGPHGKPIPIISSEWGYSELFENQEIQKQGVYLAREYLSNLVNGIVVSIWYDWKDDGTDPRDSEDHFGTVFPDLRPKPAFETARNLIAALQGFTFNKRLALRSPDDYCLVFTRGQEVRLAVWTIGQGSHDAVIPASAGRFTVETGRGERSTASAGPDGLHLKLTSAPQYLVPASRDSLLTLAAAWTPLPPYLRLLEADDYITALLPLFHTQGGRQSGDTAGAVTIYDLISGREKPARTLLKGRLSDSAADRFAGSHPATLVDRSATQHPLRAVLRADRGGPELYQDTIAVQREPLVVTPLPSAEGRMRVLVENPTGVRFRGRLEMRSGAEQQMVSLKIDEGEVRHELSFMSQGGLAREFLVAFTLYEEDETSGKGGWRAVLKTPIFDVKMIETFANDAPGALLSASGYDVVADGDPKVKSVVTGKIVTPNGDEHFIPSRAAEIDYEFAPGWKFLQVMPEGVLRQPLPKRPDLLGMWIFGDSSGDALRARFIDATGQTFQQDAGSMNWKGWRYITFPLRAENGSWWGGAQDGVVYYPIRLDTLLLVEMPTRGGGQGSVVFTDMMLVSEPANER